MNVDLRRFRHLLAVARLGSFSRAAEQLHLTQPALSHSVKGLEAEYGLRFFDRDRAGVRLTAAGHELLMDVEALLGQAGALDDRMRRWGKGEAGVVKFGLGPLAASLILPDLLTHLAVRVPALQPRVAINAAAVLLDDLERGTIEFLICGEHLASSSAALECETLCTVELAFLVRADHPLAGMKSLAATDLTAFPLLAGSQPRGRAAAAETSPLQVGIICENYHILKQVMLGSDAIWASSAELATDEIAGGTVVVLDLADHVLPSMPLQLIRIAGRSCSPAAGRVITRVRQMMASV